jgi:DNA-binding transcriptional ArsR family regulator
MIRDRTPDLPLDTALRVLDAGPRRRTLRCLLDEPDAVAIAELADRLYRASGLSGPSAPIDASTEPSRLDRHIGLIHVHLPLLERAGVVEVDRRRRVVATTDAADALAPLLSAVGAFERRRSAGF